jgi:hypothetical protein
MRLRSRQTFKTRGKLWYSGERDPAQPRDFLLTV